MIFMTDFHVALVGVGGRLEIFSKRGIIKAFMKMFTTFAF